MDLVKNTVKKAYPFRPEWVKDRALDMLAYTALEDNPVKALTAIREDLLRMIEDSPPPFDEFSCYGAREHEDKLNPNRLARLMQYD
jgi:hypothetical protein|tara:strand:+ start:2257 stop:2514 length:258 start_codon:yes stop_codon:yes gene_type:complete